MKRNNLLQLSICKSTSGGRKGHSHLWEEVTSSFMLAVPFQILEGRYFCQSTQYSKPATDRKTHVGRSRPAWEFSFMSGRESAMA